MIRYNQSLSMQMQKDTVKLTQYGTEIQLKRIPDEPRPGYFDPRESELLKHRATPFSDMSSGAAGHCTIEEIRSLMGFPNLNMNTAEIHTRFEEHDFGGNRVGIWIHWPRKPEEKKNRAGFIYLHGGGWVAGSPYFMENPCRLLAERADCVVFNIDYSLAPEKPYPNGLNDCYRALGYIYANAGKFGVDKTRIGIGGDSAGGNLAAACTVMDRDEGTRMLAYQALIYPAVTLSDTKIPEYAWRLEDYEMSEEQRSRIEPCLSLGRPAGEGKTSLRGVESMYLRNNENPDEPTISPMHAQSHRGLCKTLIAVAEFDGLRIQGEVYGKLLRRAGVDTRILRYKGVCHGFLERLGFIPQAEDLVEEIAKDLLALSPGRNLLEKGGGQH